MALPTDPKLSIQTGWLIRFVVGIVFIINVSCALAFILQPDSYVAGFELTGLAGQTLVRALGILFLMWNATYPPLLIHPRAHTTLFGIVLAQQLIGLAGETWLWAQLPAGHANLSATGLRFILFDGLGFLAMGLVYLRAIAQQSRASS
jgi:hypothetical protein